MPKLTFQKTGLTLDVQKGASFLEVCQDNDAPHDFGCTVGSCGTCVLTFVSGAENVNPVSKDEMETLEMCTDVPGARLGCQLTINGDCTVKPLK